MDQYKQLNKELVEQVQKLKLENAAFQREMNYLRDQYYDEHRKNIEAKESAIRMLTMGLKVLAPDLDLYKYISNSMLEDAGKENGFRKSAGGGARHSSGEILQELRRSSSIHQQRNVVAVSPVRRRSSQQKLNKTPVSFNESSEEEFENTTCQTVNGSSTQDEEDAASEEEEEDQRESSIKAKEPLNQQQNKVDDVESILAKDLDVIEEQTDELPKRTKNGSCSSTRKSIEYNNSSQSIPAVRFSLRNGTEKCTKSVLNAVDMELTRISVDSSSPLTSTIMDFTMQNFENATCSTPRNGCEDTSKTKDYMQRRSLRLLTATENLGASSDGTTVTMLSTAATTTATTSTTATTLNNSSVRSSRVRRNAAACVSYKEISVNAKLRNESAPLRGKQKQKQTKTKTKKKL